MGRSEVAYPLSVILAATLLAQAGGAAVPNAAPPAAAVNSRSANGPLQEIGHVKAVSPFCKAVLTHATVAVQTALADDADIERDGTWLHTTDFDTDLAKQQGAHALIERFVALRARAKEGLAEATAIRAAAKDAPTPEQAKELTDFADALAGALKRQKDLADFMGRFVAYLDSHAPVDFIDRQKAQIDASLAGATVGQASRMYGYNHSADPRDLVPPTLSEEAKATSDDLAKRHEPVYDDEDRAAQHIEPGFKDCS
jgi:hypothetical protein